MTSYQIDEIIDILEKQKRPIESYVFSHLRSDIKEATIINNKRYNEDIDALIAALSKITSELYDARQIVLNLDEERKMNMELSKSYIQVKREDWEKAQNAYHKAAILDKRLTELTALSDSLACDLNVNKDNNE